MTVGICVDEVFITVAEHATKSCSIWQSEAKVVLSKSAHVRMVKHQILQLYIIMLFVSDVTTVTFAEQCLQHSPSKASSTPELE